MQINRPVRSYEDEFIGIDSLVPLLDGTSRRYVNLDNAASTPPLRFVQQTVDSFLPYYSSVHRGTGFKSQLSTHVYERSRQTILQFVGADPKLHTCIFGKNTTEAINKLARRFPLKPGRDVVLTSGMEHHSNDLPWRNVARTIHVSLTPEGRLDEADFDARLAQYAGQVALVAVTGASNVTGFLNPIHRLARKAHAAGARILVDCAQLAPHRKVDMHSGDGPERLDYIAISAHKLYAPFGTGALIGLRDTFEEGDPDMTGGGTVEIVTLDDVVWAEPPDREEAGSPNTIGALAFAAAAQKLSEIGMDEVARHEAELTAYTLQKLKQIEAIHVFGDADPNCASERLGVIPFEMEGVPHFKLAAILGCEFGIGVRSGCFCAHPYILHLLHLTPDEAILVRNRMQAGDKSEMPGLVRLSFGLYNRYEDVEILIDALSRISRNEFKGSYIQDRASGEFSPLGWEPDFEGYFPGLTRAPLQTDHSG